jgi:predicted RNA-binding protein with PUA-like domain
LKTEPGAYSYADLERERKTTWNGVTNALALKHLRSMKKGDLAFIYHTGNEKQIVGIAEVVSDPYADPKERDPKLVMVDLKSRERLARPVTLAEVKARKELSAPDKSGKTFELVRLGRLSVMPVSKWHWQWLCQLARHAQGTSKLHGT